MRSSYRQPSLGEGFVSGIAVDRVLSYIVDLRRISPLVFHAARTLSGSLRSPPSPRGEVFVSGIAVSPIQPPPLRGTSFHRKEGMSTRAPSLGRGCRSQRGGVGFLFAAKPPPLCIPHQGRLCVEKSGIPISQPCVFLTPGEDVSS